MQTILKSFTAGGFQEYLNSITIKSWAPTRIVIHHTAAPSLAMRPDGLSPQHLRNIQEYYEGKGWSAGPHLFVDDKLIHVFSPLEKKGIHAVSFNRDGVGIEMLGDFDSEDPWHGRGLNVLSLTRSAVHLLAAKLKLTVPGCINFHRDDPKTQKTCPGLRIGKTEFLAFLHGPPPGTGPKRAAPDKAKKSK